MISRRTVLHGALSFGSIALTGVSPSSPPPGSKMVRVVCECSHAGTQWVVFDDLPMTIFALPGGTFRRGDQYLVEA